MSEDARMEHALNKITNRVLNLFVHLNKMWDELGFGEHIKNTYYDQIYQHFHELSNEMQAECEDRKRVLLEKLTHLVNETGRLSKELGISNSVVGYEDLPVLEMVEKLERKVYDFNVMKEQRLERLQTLLAQEQEICKQLGVQPLGINANLPTDEQLDSFKLYLEKQEAEKNRLQHLFMSTRRSVLEMLDQLNISPCLDFELLVCNDFENFTFTASNMTRLKEFHDDLKNQLEDTKQQAVQKREELIALWKYLDEPLHVGQAFLDQYPGHSVSVLYALNNEIKRCKEKRKENIAKYVGKMRTRLEELWDQCKFSETQRREFYHMYSQTYTDDLLSLHELEVERLQNFYESNKTIFELLTEREHLWEKIKELEQRSKDPERFYNRGGQLLAEEKERKVIQKRLPKIEEQLGVLMKDYENKNGEVFTIDGIPLSDFLAQSWEDFNKEKETLKNTRKQAKDRSTKKTPLSSSKYGAGTSRLTPGKRKFIDVSPASETPKRRNMSSEKRRPAASSSKLKKITVLSKKVLNHSGSKHISQNKSHKKRRSRSVGTDSIATAYAEFQEHLKERGELRSSVLPEQHLQDQNKKPKMKTPVKTPVKPIRKNLTPTTPNGATPKLSQSSRSTPRSRRLLNTPKLVVTQSNLPFIF
ncbi:protein regulator of cytokinesis 1 isoform X2 [Orussus abietinus]|uniref:protein regulator of cytokinesis 1 isoform X2 n=1 Tax=Orussus abietinus TaxID=222816 RepID=UPI0006252ECD|nr:protein regulator of cytokinesis 1 isoform X2 [Orussus abietinus]